MASAHTRKKPAVAQARLTNDEWDTLYEVMDVRGIESISDAIREALRLLKEETRREVMAREVEDYYREHRAPALEGAVGVTQEDLDAADKSDW